MWVDAVKIDESTFPLGNYISSSCSSALSPFILEYPEIDFPLQRLEFTSREKCSTDTSSKYK